VSLSPKGRIRGEDKAKQGEGAPAGIAEATCVGKGTASERMKGRRWSRPRGRGGEGGWEGGREGAGGRGDRKCRGPRWSQTRRRRRRRRRRVRCGRNELALPRRYVSVAYFERWAPSRGEGGGEDSRGENLGPERRAHGNNSLIDSGSSTVRVLDGHGHVRASLPMLSVIISLMRSKEGRTRGRDDFKASLNPADCIPPIVSSIYVGYAWATRKRS